MQPAKHILNLLVYMNSLQVKESLKDIIPTFSGDYPAPLLSYIDSVYNLSLQKIPILPHKADVARHHLCAYLAVERYSDKFSLPAPIPQRIPLHPKLLEKVLAEIQERVVSHVSSPTSTPTKARGLVLPVKRSYTPTVSSPLKKLHKAKKENPEPSASFTQESPFNLGADPRPLLNTESPFNPKRKEQSMSPLKNSMKTPKGSPARLALSSPGSPRYIRHLTVADFISFANNFYIPSNVTPQLLETFLAEKHKFIKKNDWLLACGIVHAAYIRINNKIIQKYVGKKSEFQDQLFQYQQGGLMKANMVMWINIIEESLKNEAWVLDLELKYVHNDWSSEDTTRDREIQGKLGRGWEIFQMMGAMINPSLAFDKPSQQDYYNTWTERVMEKLDTKI